MITTIVCAGGLLGLIGLAFVVIWQNVQRSNADGYRALRNRCYELTEMLNCVENDRNRLARRVCELEDYLMRYANLMQELDRAQRARENENVHLKQRLDSARVLVLALAQRAGVRVDQDRARGTWRVV